MKEFKFWCVGSRCYLSILPNKKHVNKTIYHTEVFEPSHSFFVFYEFLITLIQSESKKMRQNVSVWAVLSLLR